MAHLLRLIALAFLLVSGGAHAVITPVPTYTTSTISPETYGTRAAACSASAAKLSGQGGDFMYSNGTANVRSSQPGYWCFADITRKSNGESLGNSWYEGVSLGASSCPANSVPSGENCTCGTGYEESANSCIAKVEKSQAADFCKNMSQVATHTWKMVGTSASSTPSTSCYMPYPPFDGADAAKGCVTTLGDSVAIPNADGTRSWSAQGKPTGEVCADPPKVSDSTNNTPGKSVENPCPKGYPGTVNGASVCVPVTSNNGVDSTVKSTETKSDGTKTEVIEDTKCTAGNCTTTTTTNNYSSGGSLISTSSAVKNETIGTKCNTAPSSKLCSEVGLGAGNGTGSGSGSGGTGDKGESSFGGTCAQGFKAVSDDAVINAMAEETFRQNCKVNPDADSQKEGKEAYDKNEKAENMTKDNPNNSELSVGPERFDVTNAIGGGGCITDKTVTVAGKAITLPLSNVCQYLSVLGSVLMACSFLLAARIVTRG